MYDTVTCGAPNGSFLVGAYTHSSQAIWTLRFLHVRAGTVADALNWRQCFQMNIHHFGSANNEYVSVVLERRELEAAIGALLALDLSRGHDHPAITSAVSALRLQLKDHETKAA